jgi:uncharacterized membrane protein YfcA
MSFAMVLTFALSIVVGLAVGMLGGGGSILTMPVLIYAAGAEPKSAIAMSLLVVAAAAASGLIQHARAKNVEWRTGLVFGGAGMLGAFLGGRVAAYVPATALVLLFAAMMFGAGVAMLRRRDPDPSADELAAARAPSWARVALTGFGVSSFTGMVGAGGGFVIVPALVMLAGLPMIRAIGTSLLVITMSALAGLAGHLGHAEIDWRLEGIVTSGAVLGTVIGVRLAHRTKPATLRRAFAVAIIILAIVLGGDELRDLLA